MDKEAKVREWFLSKFSCSGYGFPLHYSRPNYMPKDIAEDVIKEVLPKI